MSQQAAKRRRRQHAIGFTHISGLRRPRYSRISGGGEQKRQGGKKK